MGANVHNIIDALDNEINITINDIESLDYNTIDTFLSNNMFFLWVYNRMP